jgi:hypothetical protein
MFAIVFTALYAAIRKVDEGVMTIALIFALLGIGIFLATNNPFSMLSASDKYAAATTDTQRSTLLAAGETILANTNQRAVGGFNIGLFLLSVSGLMIGCTMLRSGSFGRLTAVMGIVSNALSLADYLRQAITSSAVVAMLVILPGAITLMIWYGLIGRRLWQIGSDVTATKKRRQKNH